MGPGDLRSTETTVEQLLDDGGTVLFQSVVALAGPAKKTGQEAAGRLDVGLNSLPQLLGDGVRRMTQREGLAGVQIEVDAGEKGRQAHVHLVLGENTLGVVLALQRERENTRGKVCVGQVSEAVESH